MLFVASHRLSLGQNGNTGLWKAGWNLATTAARLQLFKAFIRWVPIHDQREQPSPFISELPLKDLARKQSSMSDVRDLIVIICVRVLHHVGLYFFPPLFFLVPSFHFSPGLSVVSMLEDKKRERKTLVPLPVDARSRPCERKLKSYFIVTLTT